jgi:hypothetical protein
VATNNDPTRGTGADKRTEARATATDGPASGGENEPSDSATPDPAKGGCLKLGWGCLPVLAGLLLVPVGLIF